MKERKSDKHKRWVPHRIDNATTVIDETDLTITSSSHSLLTHQIPPAENLYQPPRNTPTRTIHSNSPRVKHPTTHQPTTCQTVYTTHENGKRSNTSDPRCRTPRTGKRLVVSCFTGFFFSQPWSFELETFCAVAEV